MNIVQKMGKVYGEWIAVGGAGVGWSAWLHGLLDPFLLVLSVLLTLCSLVLVVPKVIKQIRDWF